MKNTHLCRCQAGFIAHAKDRFTVPAASLPGWKIRDEVIFQEREVDQGTTIPYRIRPERLDAIPAVPAGKEATYEIVKFSPMAPDRTRIPTLTLERVR